VILFEYLCCRGESLRIEDIPLSRLTERHKKAVVVHCILLPLALAQMFLLFWMVSTSLKARTEVFSIIPQWIPKKLMFSNF